MKKPFDARGSRFLCLAAERSEKVTSYALRNIVVYYYECEKVMVYAL